MKKYNENMAEYYVAIFMFLPESLFLINRPGVPLISVQRLFIAIWLVIFFALIIEKKYVLNDIARLPFFRSSIVYLLLLGVATVFTYTSNSLSISSYISIVAESIFPVFMIWVGLDKRVRLLNISKTIIYIYSVIALYGIISFQVNYNPLLEMFSNESGPRELVFTYADIERGGIRGRAQSFFSHSIQFGYISAAILIFMLAVQSGTRLFLKKEIWFISIILIVAVLSAASRSPILMLIIATFAYILNVNSKRLLKIIIYGSLCMFIIISSGLLEIIFGNRLLFVTSIFSEFTSGNSEFGGSSINMRAVQLLAALNYFEKSPIYGHGLSYIRMLIERRATGDLLGAESFAFKVMIETGILGIIGYSILYFGIFFSFKSQIKHAFIKETRDMAIIGISLLVGHLAFILSTGEMGMTNIFLILTGILLRLLYLSKYERTNRLHHPINKCLGGEVKREGVSN